MGLQAIEARPRYGSPLFLVDQYTCDMTTARWAVRHGASFQRVGASIALSPAHWLPESKTVESSRGRLRVVAGVPVTVAVCVLWLFIGAVGDNALCGESDTYARTFVATENGRKIAQANAMRDESLLVSQVVETTVVEQKQILERGRAKVGILSGRLPLTEPLDVPQGKAAQAPQSAPAPERKQALEHEQAWNKAEALARALTLSLQGELDAVRSAAEAERIKQKQLFDQQRGKADTLARELASLQAELDKARIVGLEAVQATEAEIKEKQALVQERDRADALARELGSLRAELDAARIAGPEVAQATVAEMKQKQALEQERDRADNLARELASLRTELAAAPLAGPEVVQAAEAEIKQKQALEQAIKQERDRADALARELTTVRADLDMARAAALETTQTAEAAKSQQEQAFGKERDKTETLARELAAARKEADARSALLAAAHAEVLQMTQANKAIAAEQKLALASARDRAEALERELASARDELEAGKRRIAALNALRALPSRESSVGSTQERIAGSSSSAIEGNGRSPEQLSDKSTASVARGSSVSELPRPEALPTAREAASHLVPKVAAGTERPTSASAAPSSLVDEKRLLARANALLAQADISGARLLLQHALERGSTRAAFMLAETYDAYVLQSWRASGIRGDRAKARELYEQARAGGIEGAKERIEALK
jgi:hypothetical protein